MALSKPMNSTPFTTSMLNNLSQDILDEVFGFLGSVNNSAVLSTSKKYRKWCMSFAHRVTGARELVRVEPDENSGTSLTNLPKDVLVSICAFFDPFDRMAVRSTNQMMYWTAVGYGAISPTSFVAHAACDYRMTRPSGRVSFRKFTNMSIDNIHALYGVTDLDISNTSVDDFGLWRLEALTSLTKLNLCNCDIEGIDGLISLGNIPTLTSVNLAKCNLQEGSLVGICNLPLKYLNVSYTDIYDSDLNLLCRQTLTSLNISQRGRNNWYDCRFLEVLKLTTLTANGCNVPPERLVGQQFEDLAIGGDVTMDTLAALVDMKCLTRLDLCRTSIVVDTLVALPQSITELNFTGCQILLADLVELKKLPNLIRLELIDANVSRFQVECVWPEFENCDSRIKIYLFDGEEVDYPLPSDIQTADVVRDLEGSWRRQTPL